jgi:hypothetical protein
MSGVPVEFFTYNENCEEYFVCVNLKVSTVSIEKYPVRI